MLILHLGGGPTGSRREGLGRTKQDGEELMSPERWGVVPPARLDKCMEFSLRIVHPRVKWSSISPLAPAPHGCGLAREVIHFRAADFEAKQAPANVP